MIVKKRFLVTASTTTILETMSLVADVTAEWRIKWIKDTIWRKDLHFWTNEDDWKCEVIGNIFDNPELLESEEQYGENI